ncbi:MAG: prephenate dehydratase domain-containing protein, partial [Candidatus Poribacteria bacterium]
MIKHRIAFQGEIGAYSEQAAVRYFGADIDLHPVQNFKALFSVLQTGEVDAAIAPIENALAGSVHENYDL